MMLLSLMNWNVEFSSTIVMKLFLFKNYHYLYSHYQIANKLSKLIIYSSYDLYDYDLDCQ